MRGDCTLCPPTSFASSVTKESTLLLQLRVSKRHQNRFELCFVVGMYQLLASHKWIHNHFCRRSSPLLYVPVVVLTENTRATPLQLGQQRNTRELAEPPMIQQCCMHICMHVYITPCVLSPGAMWFNYSTGVHAGTGVGHIWLYSTKDWSCRRMEGGLMEPPVACCFCDWGPLSAPRLFVAPGPAAAVQCLRVPALTKVGRLFWHLPMAFLPNCLE